MKPWPGWHCVTIDGERDEWTVDCIPHGHIADETTHLAAFMAAFQHDCENGTNEDVQGLRVL